MGKATKKKDNREKLRRRLTEKARPRGSFSTRKGILRKQKPVYLRTRLNLGGKVRIKRMAEGDGTHGKGKREVSTQKLIR